MWLLKQCLRRSLASICTSCGRCSILNQINYSQSRHFSYILPQRRAYCNGRMPEHFVVLHYQPYLLQPCNAHCLGNTANLHIERSDEIDKKYLFNNAKKDEAEESFWEKGKTLSQWFIGLSAGMLLGAAFKLAYDGGLFSSGGDSSNKSIVPSVKAAEGFNKIDPLDNDEVNNNKNKSENEGYKSFFNFGGGSGSGSGKTTPKHRAKFNFIADIVENLAPCVVFIEIQDLRRRDRNGTPLAINNGSGFVVDSDGLILTNAHVVTNRPRASIVMVRLHDGRELEGRLEELDALTDLALIRVNAKNIPAATLGQSSSLRAGEFVVAVGSPLALSNTVTAGVVSSTARDAKDLGIRANDISYIQTDAAITFGNSGGPLVNLDGEVIGINAMKAAAGISFAIPIDAAKVFLAKAREKAVMARSTPTPASPKRRRYLGITMLTLTPDIITELQTRVIAPLPHDLRHGVMVWKVVVGSPAYHAGLQPGDVVTAINGHVINSARDVYNLLEQPGDLTMVVNRATDRYTVTVSPEE